MESLVYRGLRAAQSIAIALSLALLATDLGGFFAGHERYLTEMERWMMVYDYPWAPGGKIPSWNPATKVPDEFLAPVASAAGSCYSQASTCNGWLSSPLVNPDPKISVPSNISPANVCASNPNVSTLFNNTSGWHARVHDTVRGGFSTFDSPAFPLFFLWHNQVEDVWRNWKNCGFSF